MQRVAIVGGGPAGLMAAEQLAATTETTAGRGVDGLKVAIFDAMPSFGRKFLMAGKGGMNITHAELMPVFVGRYGTRQAVIAPLLETFGPQQLRDWIGGLGIATFVGSSGRVFPTEMKAAPLLRAWLHRLRAAGVRFHMRHRWLGWTDASDPRRGLRFAVPSAEVVVDADAVVLALGGASWSRLGSDGAWVTLLAERSVEIAPLRPANCGFDVEGWTPFFAERFAGKPFKSVAISVVDRHGRRFERKGEFVATATGVEGSLIYAAASLLRDEIDSEGCATFWLDLLPDRSVQHVSAAVAHPRGARSIGSHLKSRLGLEGIKSAVLHEVLTSEAMHAPATLAETIKHLPIRLVAARPVDEAISTAGGVRLEVLDDGLMCLAMPGVHVAGEMLDWEAPTGGYLLSAAMASGVAAARGVLSRL